MDLSFFSQHNEKIIQGYLYLVATPIGNRLDITLRALWVLDSVDLIICEDTRVTKKLLGTYGINTKLNSYHDNNASRIRPQIIQLLQEKKTVAIISDAGTPLICDPGYKLVQSCIQENINITFIPGCCAHISGLVLSGLPCHKFSFLGFIPNKVNEKKHLFQNLSKNGTTYIFYETSLRIKNTLKIAKEVLGNVQAVIAREMTKKFESVLRGSLFSLHEELEEKSIKGEVVFLLYIPEEKVDLRKLVSKKLKNQSIKDIVEELSTSLNIPRNKIYNVCLEEKK